MEGKKTCTLLVSILILSTAMVNVGTANQLPKLFVDPPTYTAALLGEVFTMDINIANIPDLKLFEFKLGYNTTLLDAVDAVIGPFPQPLSWGATEIHEPEGYVWVSAICLSAVEGNGTLATITFNATYAEPVSCTLDLYDTELYDSNAALITHDVEDGSYKFTILTITLPAGKATYTPGENVQIHVCAPHEELVALEVDDPNSAIVVRTLQTGATPPGNITIVDVYPCDSFGTPKDSFERGTRAYFSVTVRNDGTVPKDVTIFLNAYDQNTVPLAIGWFNMTLAGPFSITRSLRIPDWASLGDGKVYASAFTGWVGPSSGGDRPRKGTPYCPEKSATFQITGSSQGTATLEEQKQGNNPATFGTYNMTYRIPPDAKTGVYRIYASVFYKGQPVMGNTVFGVNTIGVPDHYSTIQEAVNAASPTNNSIVVARGTYNEHITINESLTLVGIDPSNTTISGGGTGSVITITADDVKISRFTIQSSGPLPDSGIALNGSTGITISENIITSNNGYGICLNRSTGIILINNKMIRNKYNFGVFGDSFADFTHDIDTTNTVDGKPIIYWRNQFNRTVPTNAGFVAIVSSTEIVARGMNLKNNAQGILLAFTTDSLIERVNTINNDYGIYMINSHRNTIIGGTVSNNSVGIYQKSSNENIICRNNFTENANQVQIYQSSNTWNDGAGKGNYWSDYNGADLDSPPDGVGDEYLPWQEVDWYPLIDPWILTHDIAIISVKPVIPHNVTDVFPGWEFNVTVTFENKGDFTETFLNVAAYARAYDENLTIQMETITETTPLTEIAINLTWHTTGVPVCRNYTISAYVHPVPGEKVMDQGDNTLVDGKVYVRLAGDVNGDGRVRANDIILVGIALFTYPGDPDYNPYADINGDGRIGAADIIIIGIYLFESCT